MATIPCLLLLTHLLGLSHDLEGGADGFVENLGQFHAEARYWTRAGGVGFFVTDSAFVTRVAGYPDASRVVSSVVRFSFVGASVPTVEAQNPMQSRHHWLTGSDPSVVADPAGPAGVAISNAVRATVP